MNRVARERTQAAESAARVLRRMLVWGVLFMPLGACVGPNFAVNSATLRK